MAAEEKVSETVGRTRLRNCACGQEKMQVCERESGQPVLVLCTTCDKAALDVILGQEA